MVSSVPSSVYCFILLHVAIILNTYVETTLLQRSFYGQLKLIVSLQDKGSTLL